MTPERAVYLVLTTGVLASYALFALGLLAHVAGLGGGYLLRLAAMVLLATPPLTVALALLAFALNREWRGALLALALLAVLGLSLLAGLHE